MVKYLEKSPPFGEVQNLPEDKILKLVQFSIPKEWQKELIIQGFDSATQGLTDIVEFYKRLETAEDILNMQGEGDHKNKKNQAVW